MGRDRGEWYRLSRLIKHYHGAEPSSGMIVALAADYLASQPDEKLRGDAGQVRERIEEAIQELGADFPVYVLLTRCDLIEGFAEFFGVLPLRLLNQAVGWVDDPPAEDWWWAAARYGRLQACTGRAALDLPTAERAGVVGSERQCSRGLAPAALLFSRRVSHASGQARRFPRSSGRRRCALSHAAAARGISVERAPARATVFVSSKSGRHWLGGGCAAGQHPIALFSRDLFEVIYRAIGRSPLLPPPADERRK